MTLVEAQQKCGIKTSHDWFRRFVVNYHRPQVRVILMWSCQLRISVKLKFQKVSERRLMIEGGRSDGDQYTGHVL